MICAGQTVGKSPSSTCTSFIMFKYSQGRAALSERFIDHQGIEREQLQQHGDTDGVQGGEATGRRVERSSTWAHLGQQQRQHGRRGLNHSETDMSNFETIGEEELGGKVVSIMQEDGTITVIPIST